jgi:hypothetical protein
MKARNCNNSMAKCNHPHWSGQKHPLLLQCILCDWCIEIVKWGFNFLRKEEEIVKWQDEEDSDRTTGSMRKTSYNEESLAQQRGFGAMKRKRCYYFETSSSHSSSE